MTMKSKNHMLIFHFQCCFGKEKTKRHCSALLKLEGHVLENDSDAAQSDHCCLHATTAFCFPKTSPHGKIEKIHSPARHFLGF